MNCLLLSFLHIHLPDLLSPFLSLSRSHARATLQKKVVVSIWRFFFHHPSYPHSQKLKTKLTKVYFYRHVKKYAYNKNKKKKTRPKQTKTQFKLTGNFLKNNIFTMFFLACQYEIWSISHTRNRYPGYL